MSDSVRPHRRQPTRLPRPWDSPGKNTGVGCHFLLQCMKVKSESQVAQSCPTLSDPMDCSPPGSSVHGIFQARVLEWGAIAFSAPLDYFDDNPPLFSLTCLFKHSASPVNNSGISLLPSSAVSKICLPRRQSMVPSSLQPVQSVTWWSHFPGQVCQPF